MKRSAFGVAAGLAVVGLFFGILVVISLTLGTVAGSATLPGCDYPDPSTCQTVPPSEPPASPPIQERTVVVPDDTLPLTGTDGVLLLAGIGLFGVVCGGLISYHSRRTVR
jgi:hypothetical protein